MIARATSRRHPQVGGFIGCKRVAPQVRWLASTSCVVDIAVPCKLARKLSDLTLTVPSDTPS